MRVLHPTGVAIALFCLITSCATAAIRYVNAANATPFASYMSWASAATNIQDAVDVAIAGDQVVVTNGSFQGPNRIAPDILWLIADDTGPALAWYGEKNVSTSNIDRLAHDGVRYNRFYTTGTGLLTGTFRLHDGYVSNHHRRPSTSDHKQKPLA